MTARRFAPFVAVAMNTFSEVVRQPAFAIVLVATLVAFALTPALSLFSLGQEANVLKDFGLSTLLLSGLVLTCISSGNVVRREIEDRTTLTLLVKPLSREAFLAAKFAGVLVALIAALFVFTAALILAARAGSDLGVHRHRADGEHGVSLDVPVLFGTSVLFALAVVVAAVRSYRSGRSFCSAFVVLAVPALGGALALAALVSPDGHVGELAVGLDPVLAQGAALVAFAAAVLAAFAVSCAVWLGRGATFLLTTLLFLGGLWIGAPGSTPPPALTSLPDFQLFWIGDLVYEPGAAVDASYLGRMALYAVSFVVAFLALGALSLRHKTL